MSGRRLIFLPGAGADPDFWRPVGDRLPAAWDKAYLGWPGLGRQPPQRGVDGLEGLVGLVEAAMGEASVDLAAQSLGGLVAMLAALRHPKQVRRLVLTVTSAGIPMEDFGAGDWRETYYRNFPDAAPWLRTARPDLTAALPGVAQPTLLIWGDADPISPVAVGERLAALLPHARLTVIPGGDHDLASARAGEVAPLVSAHLA